MEALETLFGKKKKLVIGLMSGTSADGIDAALVEIHGSATSSKLRLIAFQTFLYPRGFKKFLLRNSSALTARLDDVTRLDMLVDRKSTRLNSSHIQKSRMPSSA